MPHLCPALRIWAGVRRPPQTTTREKRPDLARVPALPDRGLRQPSRTLTTAPLGRNLEVEVI